MEHLIVAWPQYDGDFAILNLFNPLTVSSRAFLLTRMGIKRICALWPFKRTLLIINRYLDKQNPALRGGDDSISLQEGFFLRLEV